MLIRKSKTQIALLTLLVTLSLYGCVSNLPMDYNLGPDRSLIYGYVDMSSAPTKMVWANLIQIEPKTDKPYYDLTVKDGIVYANNIPPGIYRIREIGGVGKFNASAWTYNFNDDSFAQFNIKTQKPGMYYFGSWKYVRTGKDFFKQNNFKLVPSNKQDEKMILQYLLTQATHPKWRSMIERRIAQL